MQFLPKNKYLLVETAEEKKPEAQTSGFILPEDYKKVELHKTVKLLAAPEGSIYLNAINSMLVVPANMVEQVKVLGTTYLRSEEHTSELQSH